MAMTGDLRRHVSGAKGWALLATTVVLLALAVTLTVVLSWGQSQRADARLLPGTTISGVEVGGTTLDDAQTQVAAAVNERLERTFVLEHDGRTWETSAADLGATSDLDDVLRAARARTDRADLLTLTRARFGSGAVGDHLDVEVTLPDDAVAGLVASIADEVDTPATDAELTWVDGATRVSDAATGERVDREAAEALVGQRLASVGIGDGTLDDIGAMPASADGDADTADADTEAAGTADATDVTVAASDTDDDPSPLPVEVVEPDVATATAQAAEEAAVEAIDRSLDRPIDLVLDDRRWEVSPRELGARPDGDPVMTAALATVRTSTSDDDDAGAKAAEGLTVPLSIDDESLTDAVAEVASEIDVAASNASVSWNGSQPAVTPGTTGVALDREDATAQLREAVTADGTDPAELTLSTQETSPAVTSAAFDQVLVLHQSRRVTELWRGGEVVRSWPVAVGTGGSPTPTGQFTIGAKRFEPTWVNPAPDRWGEDMPERIGPGPDNPLGARALNWNRLGGGDTLIRFHGTPNEDSIGEAASNGCVRMFNDDVIEMYDLVGSGTRVLSLD